jgi:sugar lactone lactonase YvrE
MRCSTRLLLFPVLLSATFLTGCGKKDAPPSPPAPPSAEPKFTTVSTFAGSGTAGTDEGPNLTATFNHPAGIALDAQGSLYVTDSYNFRVRKVTAGAVSTLAGSAPGGYANGPGATAKFGYLGDLTLDAQGNAYVVDWNAMIRKITPSGVVSRLAGSGQPGYQDGPGATARFSIIWGIVLDAQGNVYVADAGNNCIRKITPAGQVSTFAGGTEGYADGSGTAAQFRNPKGLAIDGQGTLFVGDELNHRIRKITPAGVVSTVAGSGTRGSADGPGSAAQFYRPTGIAVTQQGDLYVADAGNNRIRCITAQGKVTTLTGSLTPGFLDGALAQARFNEPLDVACSADGEVLYVVDSSNHRIRKISK